MTTFKKLSNLQYIQQKQKMKKSLIITLLTLFFIQKNEAQSFGKITGIVTDANKESCIGASVILRKTKDSTLVKTAITNENGQFELENLKFNDYFLSINYLGFKPFFSQKISLNEVKKDFDLATIALEKADATALKDVTITAKKPYIERKIDRTIVNVDALISNAGVTAWEVLGTSPGVRTDETGEIVLKGKSGVMIFIDDKQTFLSGEGLMNYLKSLPSGTLDKIELMSNPPAKYDAAGRAVINIKTKKNTLRGFNGGIILSYGQGKYAKSNNSFNFNYRNGKFNFFSNIGGGGSRNFNDLTIERLFFNPNGSSRGSFSQNSDIKRINYGGNSKIGLDFYATKKTTLGVSAMGLWRPDIKAILNTGYLQNAKNEVEAIFFADNDDRAILKNGGLNFNLKYQIDTTGTEITLDLDYLKYRNKSAQLFQNTTYYKNKTLKVNDDLIGNLPSNLDIYTAKADFVKPFKSGVKFESGLKITQVSTNNLADYKTRLDGVIYPNYDLSNQFIYKENINAVYGNVSREWKRFSAQGGLRIENTNYSGNQLGNAIKLDSTFKRDYTNLFPTAYISWKADTSGNHELSLNYGRRIERPVFEDLNPFVSPLDKLTFYGGNPFLRPQYSQSIEFSHTYKGFLTTTLSYGKTIDFSAETIEIQGVNYFSRTGNIGENITKSINVSATFNPTKKWTCTVYGEATNQIFRGILYTEKLDVNASFGYFNMNNQFQFGKGWSGEIGGFIQSKVPYAQLTLLPRKQINIGVQKKILKNKGGVRLSVRDVFYSFVNAGEINYVQNAKGSWTNYLDTRVATLTFSYNFNKGQTLKARKTGGADEEKKRVKNGG